MRRIKASANSEWKVFHVKRIFSMAKKRFRVSKPIFEWQFIKIKTWNISDIILLRVTLQMYLHELQKKIQNKKRVVRIRHRRFIWSKRYSSFMNHFYCDNLARVKYPQIILIGIPGLSLTDVTGVQTRDVSKYFFWVRFFHKNSRSQSISQNKTVNCNLK